MSFTVVVHVCTHVNGKTVSRLIIIVCYYSRQEPQARNNANEPMCLQLLSLVEYLSSSVSNRAPKRCGRVNW